MSQFILLWVLVSPIPAALSLPSPHTLRMLNATPMLMVLNAIGAGQLFSWMHKYRITILLSGGIIGVCLFNYLTLYYGEYAYMSSKEWADGYKQLVQKLRVEESNFKTIAVTGHYWKPYIYFLFYNQYDPVLYQATGNQDGFGRYRFGGTGWGTHEVEFDKIAIDQLADSSKTLLVFTPLEFQAHCLEITVVDQLNNRHGETMFIFARRLLDEKRFAPPGCFPLKPVRS